MAGKWVTLGKFNSDESRKECARILAEVAVSPAAERVAPGSHDISVNELILRFWRFAEQHYRHPGGATTNASFTGRASVASAKCYIALARRVAGCGRTH